MLFVFLGGVSSKAALLSINFPHLFGRPKPFSCRQACFKSENFRSRGMPMAQLLDPGEKATCHKSVDEISKAWCKLERCASWKLSRIMQTSKISWRTRFQSVESLNTNWSENNMYTYICLNGLVNCKQSHYYPFSTFNFELLMRLLACTVIRSNCRNLCRYSA